MALRDSLQLDIRPYLKALDKAEDAYSDFQKDARKDAKASARALADGVQSATRSAEKQTKAIRGLSSTLKKVTLEASREMKRLQQNAKLGLISEKDARRQMRGIQNRVAQFVRKVSSNLDDIPDSLRAEMAQAVDTVGADLRKVGSASDRAASKGRKGWGRFAGFMEDASMRIKLAMTAAFAAIGFAAERSLNSSLRSAAELDRAMTDSLAIMRGRTRELDEEMKQRARDLAQELAFQPAEVAKGYEFLALAGYEAADAYELIGETARFARAGNFDLARATDLVTDTQSALGLSVEETAQNLENMRRVQDGLIGASVTANATTEQFAEALVAGAAPALRRVNKPLEEGLGLLALFADRGIKAAAAGEQFNILLRDLPRAIGRNEDKFRALGLELTDQEGNLLDLATIVERMDAVFAGMGDTQKAATLETLGLTRGVGDAISTISGGADQIRDYTKRIREMGGITEEVSEERLTAFTLRVKRLGTAFKNLIETRLGIPAMERLGPIVDSLNDDWKNTEETILTVVKAVGLFVAALVTAKTAQLAYIATTKAAAAVTGAFRAATLLAQAAVFLFQGRLVTAKRAMILFNAAVRANPIGILITALTALGSILLFLPRKANAATEALRSQRAEVDSLTESLRELKGAQAALTFHEAAGKRREIEERRTQVGAEMARIEGAEEMGTMGPIRFKTADGEEMDLGERFNRLAELREEYDALGEQLTDLSKAQRDALAAGAGNIEFELGLLRARRDELAQQKDLTDEQIEKLQSLNELIKEREQILEERRTAGAPVAGAPPEDADIPGDLGSASPSTLGVRPEELQAASIEMLTEAHSQLEEVRTRDLTSLEKRARALEAQAAIDGKYRESLLKTADALREVGAEMEKEKAIDQFEALQERLQKLTDPHGANAGGAYEGEIAALRELAAAHEALGPEIADVINGYEHLQHLQAEGAEVEVAVRIATARHAITDTDDSLQALEATLIAQVKHWKRVADAAEDGTAEQAAALERLASAQKDLADLQDASKGATDALAQAKRLLSSARNEEALTIRQVQTALQGLQVAYQNAGSDEERDRIRRLIEALSALNTALIETGGVTVSTWAAVADGIQANMGNAIADSVMAVSEAMVGLLDDSKNLGEALIDILVQVAIQIGRLLIAMGTAELFVPGLQGAGVAKIAAGSALILAATAAKAAWGSKKNKGDSTKGEKIGTAPGRREDDLRGYEQGGLVAGKEQVIRINERGEEYVMPADKTKRYLGALEAMRAGSAPGAIAQRLSESSRQSIARTTTLANRATGSIGAGLGTDRISKGRAPAHSAGTAALADRITAGLDRLGSSLQGSIPDRIETKVSGTDLYLLVRRAGQKVDDIHGPSSE